MELNFKQQEIYKLQKDTLVNGLIDIVPIESFEKKLKESILNNKPLKIKLGLDPTAPDVHLGHTVVINKLKQFQDFGHQIQIIIGDFTGKIDEIDKYKNKAKLWCELLRETWERTIEQILFNDAVQRFNPSIQTQRLKKAKFTTELYKEIEQEMSNCSKWVHDRASNLGEDFPKPDTLKIYLENCESFIKVNNPDK